MTLKRTSALRTLLVLIVLATAVFSRAQVIQGPLSNFDVWNYTGQTANDFELTLVGIKPSQIGYLYTGNYPNTTITQVGSSTVIRWTGSSTPNGGFAHFGVTLIGVDMSVSPVRVRFTWTLDGVVIGAPPSPWQFWEVDLSTGQFIRRDIIRNPTNTPIWVQRRVAISVQPSMSLDDLMRGGNLWNEGILIDREPVAVPPGGELTFDFVMPNSRAWAVMMYDVFQSPTGRRVATFLNATNDMNQVGTNGLAKKAVKPAAKKAPAKAPAKKATQKRSAA